MTFIGWIQILIFFAATLALTKPLGVYLYRVLEAGEPPWGKLGARLEALTFGAAGVDGKQEQSRLGYTSALLLFSAAGMLATYSIARLQHIFPLNSQHLGAVLPALAFNTAASFVTNTNWQSYAGESTMSSLTQMAGLAWHNFTSAATGIGVALAVARGLTRRPGSEGPKTLGNFWIDLLRVTLFVLLPSCTVLALIFVALGVPQTLSAYHAAQ